MITLDTNSSFDTDYTLVVDGIQDVFGQTMDKQTLKFKTGQKQLISGEIHGPTGMVVGKG
jgi:hypothetical protein